MFLNLRNYEYESGNTDFALSAGYSWKPEGRKQHPNSIEITL